jgi:photosystem II stability/assembly factor-like uncharacterized protein
LRVHREVSDPLRLTSFIRRNPPHDPSWGGLVMVLLTAAFSVLPWTAARAQTDPAIALAEQVALNQPSHMTLRALHGLFTSVTRAGNRLVAVGERGWVIVSDDNGLAWRQVPSPTSVTLTHVTFATPTDGWAVGGMGIVLHSTDGGLTWTKQLDGTQAANTALAAANADIKQSGTNATTTANLQAAQSMVSAGPTVPFLDVYASAASDVMIAGAFGMAFASNDGGATWQSLADFMPNPNGLHIYQILQDQNNYAVAGEQGLLLYGPAGKPLATINTPFQGSFFGEVFAPDHSWIVFGLQGTILRSTDQGTNWATVSAGAPVGIDCGTVLKDGDVTLGNEAGQLLTSHDNGQTYSVSAVGEPVVSLTQAADGAIILVGPAGPRRISLDKLGAGA